MDLSTWLTFFAASRAISVPPGAGLARVFGSLFVAAGALLAAVGRGA